MMIDMCKKTKWAKYLEFRWMLVPVFMMVSFPGMCQGDPLPIIDWKKPADTLVLNRASDSFQKNQFVEARKLIHSLPKKHYRQQPGVLSFIGQCYYYEGNYDLAVKYLSMALEKSPESTGLNYYRGYALKHMGKFKGAASDFAAYYIHRPDKETVLNLSLCLAEDGHVDQAIKLLEAFEPKDTTIYKELGYNYDEVGDSDKAIINFEKVLAQDPTEIESLEYLSLIYAGLNNYEKAFQLIDQLLQHHPDHGRGYYVKGTYYQDTNDLVNAQKFFDLAQEKGYIVED